jgi:hypothetical protein
MEMRDMEMRASETIVRFEGTGLKRVWREKKRGRICITIRCGGFQISCPQIFVTCFTWSIITEKR